MAGIDLDYLTSLSPIEAKSLGAADLTLVSKDGKDYSMRISELEKFVRDKAYRVGGVYWFMINVNPNNDYPGQVWKRVPNAANRTLRFCADDASDLGQAGGSDSKSIQTGHLPAHAHTVNISTSATDLGNKVTDAQGNHAHRVGISRDGDGGNGSDNNAQYAGMVGETYTTTDGLHQHNVYIGAHAHNVSGVTGNTGGGAALDVINTYIKLSAWYRAS